MHIGMSMNTQPSQTVCLLILFSALAACAGRAPLNSVIPAAGHKQILLPDGARYKGPLVGGLMEGQGTLNWPNGSRYDGEFHHGLMAGQGKYRTAGGDIYQGSFQQGMITGKGIYSFANGDRYEGELKQGNFSGKGTLTRHNGNRYTGSFHDNLFEGQGVYHFVHPRGGKKQLVGQWRHGHFIGKQAVPEKAGAKLPADSLIPEFILFRQYRLLARAVNQLRPTRLNVPDLYFIAFGADGHQDVFMKEAEYTKHLFEQEYGAGGRSLLMVNNRQRVKDTPLASVVNLTKALNAIARKMDVKEDILFLYLTSHGSRDHQIAVNFGQLPLANLSAPLLALLLDNARIKWKVVVISACYSGAFIDALKSDTTLVITSARADRRSFGCRNDVDMSYFGRAFFQRALPQTNSFIDAFYRARKLVTHWEDEDNYDHSVPQISIGSAMKKKLRAWRASLTSLQATGERMREKSGDSE